MPIRSVAVVLPAYNEAGGLPSFLVEIADVLAPIYEAVRLIVIDDKSTDDTALEAAKTRGTTVHTQPVNRGHGPSALVAYEAGIADMPDAVIHVDGDGQFFGRDLLRVLQTLDATGADVVHGVRWARSDPWYRHLLTATLGRIVSTAVHQQIPDVNTPLRAYRPPALAALISGVPADSVVPHVHLSIAEVRMGCHVEHVIVQSIPRRGAVAVGTMWHAGRMHALVPPARLVRFAVSALGELWRVSLHPDAPMRDLRGGAAATAAAHPSATT